MEKNVFYVIFDYEPLGNGEYDVFWNKEKAIEFAESYRDSDLYRVKVTEMRPTKNGSFSHFRTLLEFYPTNYD